MYNYNLQFLDILTYLMGCIEHAVKRVCQLRSRGLCSSCDRCVQLMVEELRADQVLYHVVQYTETQHILVTRRVS